MTRHDFDIPPERERQFDLIKIASDAMFMWARTNGKSLEHIYPVVPFVETDYSLDAFLFVDTEERKRQYESDGTSEAIAANFRAELARANYPVPWLEKVVCHFASKEVVDRDFEGSYYNFLR